MKVKRNKIPLVRASVVESTTERGVLSLRGLDGHTSTLRREWTEAFAAGDEIVLLRKADYEALRKGGPK